MGEDWKGEDLIRRPRRSSAIVVVASSAEAAMVAEIRAAAEGGLSRADCAALHGWPYHRVNNLAQKYAISFENGNSKRRWDRRA